jgi:hypothetical protein
VKTLKRAILEAERFLVEAKKTADPYSAGKLNGAIKRSSMDLTRSLSELRKQPVGMWRDK